jgi:hypothetical protein
MEGVRIKSVKARRSGKAGIQVCLPATWCQDVVLSPGDTVDFVGFSGTDDLIIRKRSESRATPERGGE